MAAALVVPFLSLMRQGLAQAIGGFPVSGSNVVVGFLLSFLKSGDELGEQQVKELKQINQTLLGVRQDLSILDSDLKGIQELLEQILGQDKLATWLSKQNTIAQALAHIETDYSNYVAFTTPTPSGQLPKVSPADRENLAKRAYKSSGLNDEEAVTMIQQAVLGSGGGDGLLDLFTDLLIDRVGKSDPANMTSKDLDYLANGLVSYFARLLASQLDGIAVVLDCKCMDGVDPTVRTEDWDGFQDAIKSQEKVFLDALWRLVSAWVFTVDSNYTSGGGAQFGTIAWLFGAAQALYSDNDLLAWVPGGPVMGTTSSQNEVAWLKNKYAPALASPEQSYFSDSEKLIAATTLASASARRVVLHVLFYIGAYSDDPVLKTFAQPIPLASASVVPAVDVRSSIRPRTPYVCSWVRQVFDLAQDGTYKMADVRSTFPTWPGYDGTYNFQSDADLNLTTTVDAKNPVGIIRFVPYVQQK